VHLQGDGCTFRYGIICLHDSSGSKHVECITKIKILV